MNTIQAQNLLSPAAGTVSIERASNEVKADLLQHRSVQSKSDHYSATAANDSIVARVMSSAIDQSLNRSVEQGVTAHDNQTKVSNRFSLEATSKLPSLDFESVTANVIGFVSNALANLAQRGFDSDKLNFFKKEAITGVEVGVDLAKLDLIGIASNDTFAAIDKTRDGILEGINQLSTNPMDYAQRSKTTDDAPFDKFASISVNSINNEPLKLDFESRAFNASGSYANANTYTTSSSNITFSLQGAESESTNKALANLVNKIDGLANSFYRGDVQSAHSKSLEMGYSNQEILALANQLDKADKFQQMKTYGDIQHLDAKKGEADFASPRTVAEYVNKYLDVIESSHSVLSTTEDFNQVINGIVNQMKDVQVPDVLQAINRLHAFNNQFSSRQAAEN